jgi:hypothetical protein
LGGKNKFNEPDFIIKDFGIGNDGNQFLAVERTAGGTISQKENSGYAYVFVTNNGTFSVSSDWVYPQWHTHELTLNGKNCVTSMKMDGGNAEVEDVVKLETNATDIQRVMTVEFTLSSQDGSLCVTKIFNSIPKT